MQTRSLSGRDMVFRGLLYGADIDPKAALSQYRDDAEQ